MKKLFFALALAILSITGVNAQSKIGHVNSNKVLDTIPSRKAAIAEINQIRDLGIAELTDMDSTLQAMYLEYQTKQAGWTALVKQTQENKIRMFEQRMQEREQIIDGDIQALTNDINKKSLDMVKKAVTTVSELKKLNYVIDESVTLYTNGGTDITAEVIKEVLRLDAIK